MDSLLESALNAAALRPDGVSRDDVAYEQGREAFLDGYADDLNPYQRGTLLHHEWERGWDHEYNAHIREVDSDERDRQLLNRRT